MEHSKNVDDPKTAASYPASILKFWKLQQIEEYDRLKQGWGLDDDMADLALAGSYSDIGVIIQHSTVNMGGQGGTAPGAGGGGGGAIGPSARAGDGGNGGDMYSGVINLSETGDIKVEQLRINVGKGGTASYLPGQHSASGDDTTVDLLSDAGAVLHTIRMKGGKGARSGQSYLPDGVNEITSEDLYNGFRITTFMPVNAVDVKEGLIFILGGGWSSWRIAALPCDATWCVVGTASWHAPLGTMPKGFYISLCRPNGEEAACVSLVIDKEHFATKQLIWHNLIGATFDVEGSWLLRVVSGGYLLSEVSVEVSLPT
jgi:hypothetical protein